jgi:peroxiredoxin
MKPRSNSPVGRTHSAKVRKYVAACVVSIAIAFLAAVAWGTASEATGENSPSLLGKAAPDFALINLSGKTVRLSDFKGKIVLLDFWATWCPPCREEIRDFVQLQKQYSGKGFTVLGVALDDSGAAVVKPLAQKLGVNYPLLIGNTPVADKYGGIQALPTAFLIGRDGKILNSFVGARAKSEWEQTIQTALRQAED